MDARGSRRARIRAATARRRRQRRILHQAFERAIRHRLPTHSCITPRKRQRGGQRFRRFSASMSGRNRFAATWRRSSRLRDVQHRWLLQRGHVSQGGDRRSAAALPVAIRPDHYVAEIEAADDRLMQHTRRLPAGRRLPGLQRASGKPAADTRRRADDGVRLAGPGAARAARGLSVALVTVATHSPDAVQRHGSRLLLDRADEAPPIGRYSGFTVRNGGYRPSSH